MDGYMTAPEFEDAMKRIRDAHGKDYEAAHHEADKLVARILRSLGYRDGITVFEEIAKWTG